MHLAQARDKLLEAGVLYPELGAKSNAHHLLFAAAHPGAWGMHRDVLSSVESERSQYFRDTFSQIMEQAASERVEHVVLSSEYWWGQLPVKFQKVISEQFHSFETRLVACVRRQDRWLEASYLQAVKSGESRIFKEWLDDRLKTANMGGANYLKILNHWAEVLLPSDIQVVPYEFKDRTEYIRRVANIVCDSEVADIVVPDEAKVVNRSPTAKGVEELIKVNECDNISEKNGRVAEILKVNSRPENKSEAELLTLMEQKELYERFVEINRLVSKAYRKNREHLLFEGL